MSTLAELVHPERAAVLTMELQRGVVGDLSCMPPLAEAALKAGVVPRTAALVRAARAAGAVVIHCKAAFRADRRGSFDNVPLVNRLLENPKHMLVGAPESEVVPELGPEPSDLESERLHGMSPFHGTSLDPMLRSVGARTVIATGVSLNVGVVGLVIEAINHGYHVVLPTDCVAAHPPEYGEAVIEHSLTRITTRCTSDEIVALWAR